MEISVNNRYTVFENLSIAAGLGVTVFSITGETLFESSLHASSAIFFKNLYNVLDCAEACHIAMLYGCYQARRFGDRYIFINPAGLVFCVSPLKNNLGEMISGVAAGPFLMTDHDEYMEIDIMGRHSLNVHDVEIIKDGLHFIPLKTPIEARAISEQLFINACYSASFHYDELWNKPQTDVFTAAYSIEKEDELLSSISMGDIQNASRVLNDILGQILFHSGNDLEVLRSHVVELTVLLSRAALKGGADINAIFGLNYSYLREIDALTSVEDTVLWLHNVTSLFARHVFDFAGAKHVDVIYKAVAYIKQNHAGKITLQDVSDHVFLSLAHFCKIFKEETGQTPGSYISAVRIDESKKLLHNLSVNIVDIPELVGFESQSYFTRVFKKSEGCTPGRFRQKYLERADLRK